MLVRGTKMLPSVLVNSLLKINIVIITHCYFKAQKESNSLPFSLTLAVAIITYKTKQLYF